jgi:hypothetical protein
VDSAADWHAYLQRKNLLDSYDDLPSHGSGLSAMFGDVKRVMRGVGHAVVDVAGVVVPQAKDVQRHLLKRNTMSYTKKQKEQREFIARAYKQVDPSANFYVRLHDPVIARLAVASLDDLTRPPSLSADVTPKYKQFVDQVLAQVCRFQDQRYPQNTSESELDAKVSLHLRLNDPVNVVMQEFKAWIAEVAIHQEHVCVRQHAAGVQSHLHRMLAAADRTLGQVGQAGVVSAASAAPAVVDPRLQQADALARLKDFTVQSQLSVAAERYRSFLLELMSSSLFQSDARHAPRPAPDRALLCVGKCRTGRQHTLKIKIGSISLVQHVLLCMCVYVGLGV